MNQAIGYGALSVAFLASLSGCSIGAYALIRSNFGLLSLVRQWIWLTFGGTALAFVIMEVALFQRDYSLDYVRQVGSSSTPLLYNFAAIWSSLEGSLLLWALVLAGFVLAVGRKFKQRQTDELFGWALVVMFAVTAFFLALLLGPANPFSGGAIPDGFTDGPGPNPLLQNHILVAFHPPLLYLGYVGFTVPFAFAIASLVTGRLGEGWLLQTRRWTVLSWSFLTLGIILGAWWSYEVLGWGGFWAWDPVENASILPWLTGTAYLHSVMIQERKAMLRVWNLSLICATFALTIFGTFLTRSGVFESVHAFSESNIGPWLLSLFAVVSLGSVVLIGLRGGLLAEAKPITSAVSREAAFLVNNLVFGALAFVIIVGTTFPLLAELLDGTQLTIARPYFDTMTRPLGLLILFLMAAAPVIPWGAEAVESYQKRLAFPAVVGLLCLVSAVVLGGNGIWPLITFALAGFAGGSALRMLFLSVRRSGWSGVTGRKNGGMVVHLGVVLLAFGLAAAESYRVDQLGRLSLGETLEVAGTELTYLGSGNRSDERIDQTFVNISINNGDIYAPAITRYRAQGMVVPTPSVKSGLFRDIYLVVDEVPEQTNGPIRLRAIIRPMVIWIWIGGLLMAVGSLLAVFRNDRNASKEL